MKLMYDLPTIDQQVYDSNIDAGEKLMYIAPFNVLEDNFVDGWTVITDRRIYTINNGQLINKYELGRCSDFKVEVLYGSHVLHVNYDDSTTFICRFIGGRHHPRYSFLVNVLNELAEKVRHHENVGDPVTNDDIDLICPKCGSHYASGTATCQFCRSKKEVYTKLWGLTKGLRWMMFFPLLVACISLAIQFILPAIQRVAVNDYLTNESIRPVGSLADPNVRAFLLIFLAIVAIDLVQRILGVIQSRLSAVSGSKFTLMMRSILYEKVSTLSLAAIQKRSVGDIMGRITSDVNVVQDFVTNQLPSIFTQAVSFVFALIFLLILNPVMSMFVFIPIPLVVFIITKIWASLNRMQQKASTACRKHAFFLQDSLTGIRIVKALGTEDREVKTFNKNIDVACVECTNNNVWFDTIFPLIGFLVRIGSYFILFYGNYLLFKGAMDFGELHQFSSYSNIIYAPLV